MTTLLPTLGGITREARTYAVQELFRRAGVTGDLYHSWVVDFEGKYTTVRLGPGGRKLLRFPHARFPTWEDLRTAQFYVLRAGWMHPSAGSQSPPISQFVVPFSETDLPSGFPLFQQVADDCVQCSVDLPLSAILTLSRFEEDQTSERDLHGRFASKQSLASKHGFLTRPIVDEYGLALEQALSCLLPRWRPIPRKLRAKLSHDVDLVGIPWSWRETVGHAVKRHDPVAVLRDVVAAFTSKNPSYLEMVLWIADLSSGRGLDSAFYWKASSSGRYDSGYDPRHPKIHRVITWLSEHGIENGVHPGYETFKCSERLAAEVQLLKEAIPNQPLGGRQHYLRWCQETWLDWEACGLAYDSTVGFADALGFRAGTCIPYRPWLMAANREARLLEIPLVVMDSTPIGYMGLTPQASLPLIEECLKACRMVGGVFTLLWHNTTLLDPAYGNLYENLLDRLEGAERFDWRTCLEQDS